MPRIIEITVSPTGETTIQTKGYAGNDCFQASKFLEEILGVKASDRPNGFVNGWPLASGHSGGICRHGFP